MLRRAPVAFLCTRMSLDLANLVRGPRAPERAIFALFSSWVARLVMHPTALHWTSTFVESICRIRGWSPPIWTMRTLFSAIGRQTWSEVGARQQAVGRDLLLTARLPRAALAAR
jgi:hypothetical protein